MPALVGGGLRAKPGEISLSHHGVLFLDEFAEFQPAVLDSLRQPLEIGRRHDRAGQLSRHLSGALHARRRHEPVPMRQGERSGLFLPARTERALRGRLSGAALRSAARPHRPSYQVPAVTAADCPAVGGRRKPRGRNACGARARPADRTLCGARREAIRTNAQASGPLLEEVAKLDKAGLALIRDAADAMRLSARGYHRVLRVARTLADLDGAETVGRLHLAEALSYRALADQVRRAA